METSNRMSEITSNLKKDMKDLLTESANIVTGFFKRGFCTMRVVADKWKTFASNISDAVDTLMKPAFATDTEKPQLDIQADSEPIVTIVESEAQQYPVGKRMTLAEADKYIAQMDKRRFEAKDAPCAVKVRIDYMWGLTSDRYYLPLQIGSGRGGLLDQMEQHLTPYRANPEMLMQELDISKLDKRYQEDFRATFLPFLQRSVNDLSNSLLPYFRAHCNITKAADILASGMSEKNQTEDQKALNRQVSAFRQAINSNLPQQGQTQEISQQAAQEPPQQGGQKKSPQSRTSVKARLNQIKTSQKSQVPTGKMIHVPNHKKTK